MQCRAKAALGRGAKLRDVPRVPLTVLAVAAAALPGCAAVQAADQDPPATAAAGVRADTLAGVARRIYRQGARACTRRALDRYRIERLLSSIALPASRAVTKFGPVGSTSP